MQTGITRLDSAAPTPPRRFRVGGTVRGLLPLTGRGFAFFFFPSSC
jgi:hypothetical protein